VLRSRLWRDRDFLKLWCGQAVSQIGSRITREGLPLTAAIILNARPLDMGLLSGAVAAAVLLFGLFAGAWVDRLRRRPVMITTDVFRALSLAAIPFAAWGGWLSMPLLYAVAAVAGVLSFLFDSAYQSYLPSLIDREDLLDGNSKLAASEAVAEVSGPALSGILIFWLTAPIAILFDAISFLVSAASLGRIIRPEPKPAPRSDQHIFREIREGLDAAWRDPILRAMACRIAMSAFFAGFMGSLYVIFAIRELKLNPAQLGLVISVGGGAALVGTLITQPLVRTLGIGRTYIAAALFGAFGILITALAHGPVWLCCIYLATAQSADIAWPAANIAEVTIRQSIAPAYTLGRVNSAMQILFRGLLPVGALTSGALAHAIGIRPVLLIAAAGFLLSAGWLIASPIRNLENVPSCPKNNESTLSAAE
jgi:Na+/melibiose symporter-like transporter